MSPEQRELARHALGLPNDRRRSYRNRYHAPPGSDSWHAWAKLCDAGWAVFERGNRNDFFSLTRSGAEAVLRPGETLDLEDFPHD
jgi:hypothetical protein